MATDPLHELRKLRDTLRRSVEQSEAGEKQPRIPLSTADLDRRRELLASIEETLRKYEKANIPKA